jgi:hypothetical protein
VAATTEAVTHEGSMSLKMRMSWMRTRSNSLHLVIHGSTTAMLVHLHDRYVMMNMLQN